MADEKKAAVPAVAAAPTPGQPVVEKPYADPTLAPAIVAKDPTMVEAEDQVEMKPLRPYLGAEDKRSANLPGHDHSKPYSVTRRRAAELRAGGLAEYTNSADHDREVDDAAKKAGDAARKKYEVKR